LSRITIIVPDNKDAAFRKLIIDVYGVSKGALAQACSDAIDLWIEKYASKGQPKREQIPPTIKKQPIPPKLSQPLVDDVYRY